MDGRTSEKIGGQIGFARAAEAVVGWSRRITQTRQGGKKPEEVLVKTAENPPSFLKGTNHRCWAWGEGVVIGKGEDDEDAAGRGPRDPEQVKACGPQRQRAGGVPDGMCVIESMNQARSAGTRCSQNR